MHHAEHGGVRADAERQRDGCDERESGMAAEEAECVAEILPQLSCEVSHNVCHKERIRRARPEVAVFVVSWRRGVVVDRSRDGARARSGVRVGGAVAGQRQEMDGLGAQPARDLGIVSGLGEIAVSGARGSVGAGVQVRLPQPEVSVQARAGAAAAVRQTG